MDEDDGYDNIDANNHDDDDDDDDDEEEEDILAKFVLR